MVIRLLIVLVLMTVSLSVAGCHTVEGVGKDIQSLGEALQDAAE